MYGAISIVCTVAAYELHKRKHHALGLVFDVVWLVCLVLALS